MNPVTRSVCFTIFGDWNPQILADPKIKCAAVQREKCPETGREHYQGFLMLASTLRYAAIKKLLQSDSAHLEKTMGTPQQAWDYCTKEETRIDGPWTFGNKPVGQGNR